MAKQTSNEAAPSDVANLTSPVEEQAMTETLAAGEASAAARKELSPAARKVLDAVQRPPVASAEQQKKAMAHFTPHPSHRTEATSEELDPYTLQAITDQRKTEAVALELAARYNVQVPLADGSGRVALPNGPVVDGEQPR